MAGKRGRCGLVEMGELARGTALVPSVRTLPHKYDAVGFGATVDIRVGRSTRLGAVSVDASLAWETAMGKETVFTQSLLLSAML
jgi:hypothetical protein